MNEVYTPPEGSTLTSRCDICHEVFTVVMREGQLVDPKDMERPVSTAKGEYAHASCLEQQASDAPVLD
jgi:hypothetical protein